MCGITGFLNLSGKPADALITPLMTKPIAHRGPDGEGFWHEGPLAIGHLRLAIIDPHTTSDQPMLSADKRYVLAFNGEIYNHNDIRRELQSKGVRFITQGDTEVLLQALIFWGEDALIKLNGMFAFIFIDRKEHEFILGRDRFGVKPLYYTIQNGIFAFGSEIKAILGHPQITAQLNKAGLAEYLTFMNYFSDNTLFDGIKLMPAGSYIKLPYDSNLSSGQTLPFTTFWDFRFTGEDRKFNADAIADDIHHSFKTAVERQLMSDVGVSSFLSGGVDSGSITALAASAGDGMRTFTAGFDISRAGQDANFDERAAAEIMAREFRTEHYEVLIKSDDFERTLSSLCYQLEEPRVGQSYPNFMASHLASKFEKVVLSGCGGDELFGGYPWRYFNGLPADNFDQYIDGYYSYWRRLSKTDEQLNNLLAPIKRELGDFNSRDIFTSIYPSEARSAKTPEALLNWSLYFETKTFMNGLLVVEDKVSMANSLETRVPFLDNDLVDLACEISIHAKISNIDSTIKNRSGLTQVQDNTDRRSDGKVILRHMMSRLVPEEIYNRSKQGFSAPDESWFRNESRGFIHEKLLGKGRIIHDILNKKDIEDTLERHNNGSNERLKIWSLLHLAEVFDAYGL